MNSQDNSPQLTPRRYGRSWVDALSVRQSSQMGMLILFVFGLGMFIQWLATMAFGVHWLAGLPAVVIISTAILGRRVIS